MSVVSIPGLVCTVFNWARPRDLSHYETFEHYHATFYKHVEALSVTPFSAGAIYRGLAALLVSLVRLRGFEFNHPPPSAAICRSRRPVLRLYDPRTWVCHPENAVVPTVGRLTSSSRKSRKPAFGSRCLTVAQWMNCWPTTFATRGMRGSRSRLGVALRRSSDSPRGAAGAANGLGGCDHGPASLRP